ncbi:phosphotransferase [Streptomyces sp. NPDC058685]|uniref:phosphotransferase n=1 Tax=Streptomyces sp. NPDC058685 TaxID=3346598 RepID=UPI00364D2494
MTVDAASEVRRQAGALSRDDRLVIGPLEGHHHETYAFPLPVPLKGRFERAKLRVRRPDVVWFDSRCFEIEDELLRVLQDRIDRIPVQEEVLRGVVLTGFIEGGPLGRRSPTERQLRQLGLLFRQLAAVPADALSGLRRTGGHEDHGVQPGDSGAFLNRLIGFTADDVLGRYHPEYGELFTAFGVESGALEALRPGNGHRTMTDRPFSLLHGDLHRDNFIVDLSGDLWTIDWELALIGDPLYELATHLHLMRYTDEQETRVARLWAQALDGTGATRGWDRDLPHLLDYKRVQSVVTDIVRAARTIGARPDATGPEFHDAASRVHRALVAAREPLRLTAVPSLERVMAVHADWLKSSPRPHPEQHP